MKYDNYDSVHIADDLSVFEFISSGPFGEILKRIIFVRTDWAGVYNLALGNVGKNGEMEDTVISDNGDRNKILATIVKAIDLYTRRYPRRWVYFIGNTKGKTRLYRMAVGLNLEELSLNFEIYARAEGAEEFVLFRKNMEINDFLVRRKIVI